MLVACAVSSFVKTINGIFLEDMTLRASLTEVADRDLAWARPLQLLGGTELAAAPH